jgi:23S rRNA (guanine745-N1)-methyltransferase
MVGAHDGRTGAPPTKPVVAFRCPHCSLDLVEYETTFSCASGHSFDRAREGYVNLLVGGRLPGGSPGDDEAMVRARREVFDAGLYSPVIDVVAGRVAEAGPAVVLDAGCGEGSYLARAAALSGAEAHGIDISKPAVRLAARRHRTHRYAVASSFRLPFADTSFAALMNVFSPRPFDEMLRVLAPGGIAVVATPGAGHLAQLKALIYDLPRSHREPDETDDPGGLRCETVDRVAFTIDLCDVGLRLRLLEMTPYWWSTDPARREVIASTLVSVDVDVLVSTYRRVS